MASSDDAFGADLYQRLPAAGNLVFSPSSIAIALRLVLLGARGETAAQIAAALHLGRPDQPARNCGPSWPCSVTWPPGTSRSARRAPCGCNRASRWNLASPRRWPPRRTRAATVALRDADFRRDAEQARQEINQVIAEQTAGRISDLLGPGVLDASTSLVLASAVYLKAAWAHPFPAGATQGAPFHPDSGIQVTVPTMRLEARLRYVRGDGFQAVGLPYAGSRLGLLIVLPDGPPGADSPGADSPGGGQPGDGPPGIGPDSGGLGRLLARLAPRQVSLALPRFRVTSGFALRPLLAALGMPLAFSPDADFSGITTAQRLRIDEVAHKAYIDVNEEGTEAAAATAVIIKASARFMNTEPPVEVIVDRPFLFAITDMESGLPLFLGRVTDPTAG